MTTLYPQIKRVDEDETSKIIKNVLFGDQDHDEEKLEQIFDEFMHLTEESITYSDDEIDDFLLENGVDDGGESEDKEGVNGDNDDNDDDDDDDDDDDSESGSESDSSESGDDDEDDDSDGADELDGLSKQQVKQEMPAASREPTSWNLDQFINAIPVASKPQKQSPQKQTPQKQQQQQQQLVKPKEQHIPPKSPQPQLQPPPPTQISTPKRSHTKKDHKEQSQPLATKRDLQQVDIKPDIRRISEPQAKHRKSPKSLQSITPQSQPQLKVESRASPISPKPQQLLQPKLPSPPVKPPAKQPQPQAHSLHVKQPQPKVEHHTSQSKHLQPRVEHHTQSQPQSNDQHHQTPSNGSYLVQIDLSKLKRIPTTKAPTPTVSNSSTLSTAKSVKHEADAEKDKIKQSIKYLEAGMYFLLHGTELDQKASQTYYVDLIPLFKHICRVTAPSSMTHPDNMTNLKVYTLTLRTLSLLFFNNYRSRECELMEASKVIRLQQDSSPPSTIQQADSLLIGIKPQLLSAYTKQVKIFSYLKEAHDYWHRADYLCDQHPAIRVLLSTIDSNCGHLSMISHIQKLADHIRCGLKLLRTT